MKASLKILHLEDDFNDAALIESTLKFGGISPAITCVQTRADFVTALEAGGIDLILSDFSLPGFDGLAAAEIVRDRWPEIPLILVSGSLGEERAIDSFKNGATDYVLKERLARLVPAVRRAMQGVEAKAESKRLEKQLIEAQKMEVIGHLAGGVAHDFNNILGVIIGYTDLLLLETGLDAAQREFAEEIRQAAARATALTRQLLVISRKQTVQPVVLDLNQVVAEMEKMLRRLIGENIAMTQVPGQALGRIKADAGYVGQVLMNMVINARDAMPNGGKLTIATSNATLDEAYVKTHTGALVGDYVMLSISDTGTGMTDEVKARLFEAFFTTKPKDRGTGLGLATCQTIMKQSGGHIGVYSELGHGTTFKVYFPRVDQPLNTDTEFFKKGPLPRGSETILLVEDEPAVRHLASNVLTTQGYNVIRANNGQDGLHAAREHKGTPIALVVTDVIMPQMGGKVMVEWLKTIYPELKVLFTSGYTDDAIAQHGVLDPGVAFLPKPYTPAALAHKVREVLNSQNSAD